MRALLCLVLAASIIGPAASTPAAPEWRVTYSERPRVVVTTDGEIDDRCSMDRSLLYTNEWETCGLIFSSSTFHWKGTASVQAHDWQGGEWLQRQLDAYAGVYPNLRKHDPRYPSPDSLRRQVFEGNVGATGDMEHPTPGSDRIVELLLDSNPAPVWLEAWGGPNTIRAPSKPSRSSTPSVGRRCRARRFCTSSWSRTRRTATTSARSGRTSR